MSTHTPPPLWFRVCAALSLAECAGLMFFTIGTQLSTWFNDLTYFFVCLMALPFWCFFATLIGYGLSPRLWQTDVLTRMLVVALIPIVPLVFGYLHM